MVHMDEMFGFAPPTAEPPSKKPILTLFKQAGPMESAWWSRLRIP